MRSINVLLLILSWSQRIIASASASNFRCSHSSCNSTSKRSKWSAASRGCFLAGASHLQGKKDECYRGSPFSLNIHEDRRGERRENFNGRSGDAGRESSRFDRTSAGRRRGGGDYGDRDRRPPAGYGGDIGSRSTSRPNSVRNSGTSGLKVIPPPPNTVRRYFATCLPGLEEILVQELSDPLGHIRCRDVTVERSGVSFSEHEIGSREVGYRALFWSRVAHRVLELICTNELDVDNRLKTSEDLYDFVRGGINVDEMFLSGNGRNDGEDDMPSLSVRCNIGGYLPQGLSHSHYTALTVKNALVDAVRDSHPKGLRPDVDTNDADLPFVLALKGPVGGGVDRFADGGVTASLYRSMGGQQSLHRRGYRRDATIHKAAMKETMAAGLLYAAGWHRLIQAARADNQGSVLLDPMAGSGTFCLEAALMAADIAPGLVRQRAAGRGYIPATMRWKSADWKCWQNLVSESVQQEMQGMEWIRGTSADGRRNCVIAGNDIEGDAVFLAETYCAQIKMKDIISFNHGNCKSWCPREENFIIEGRTIVVTNPPWGVRLTEDVEESWLRLNEFFRRECTELEAWVLSGNKDLTRILRMKKSRSIPLNTADENLRWLQYHIFPKKTD